VQEDIERADAKALAGILNQDLVRVWVQLEYGPRPRYPRIVIARPEAEDLQQLASSLGVLVPLGLRVSESEVRDKFGLSDPQEGERLLGQPLPAPNAPHADPANAAPPPGDATPPALHAIQDPVPDPASIMAGTLATTAAPAMDAMIETLGAMLDSATSIEELRELILAAWPKLDTAPLARALAEGFVASGAAGRVAVVDEADDDA
jgi:phage gp29-like protein